MAERLGVVERVVKDLEKEITCSICHDQYTEPKALPCCHYYCKLCIYRLALRTGMDKPFLCPECRKPTTLPQGSVSYLPAAFVVNRMKDVHSKLEQAHGRGSASCEMCSGAISIAFCQQCSQYICAECVKQHRRMKIFTGHNLNHLDHDWIGSSDVTVLQDSSIQKCKLHLEPMKMFCFQCNCLICRDCTIKTHGGHNCEFISVAAPEMKKNMTQHLKPLKEISLNLSHAVAEVKSTKSEVEVQWCSVTDTIETSFDELQKVLNMRKKELLDEVAIKMTQKLERLSDQEETLSTSCAVTWNVIEYTENCLKQTADFEFMCIHDDIYSRVRNQIKEQSDDRRSLMEPVEEVDIGVEVSCIEELKELCYTKAKVTKILVDPTKCSAIVEGKRISEVHKLNILNMDLVQVLFNGTRSKQTHEVMCHLKSLVNNSIIECDLHMVKGSQYQIHYTPTLRGLHEIIVKVGSLEVAGSPFSVFVSISPTRLGKPVRVITGLTSPYDIAVNSKGDMVVTEYCGGGVVVLDKKGEKLKSLKGSDFNIVMPTGVAFDDEDSMYIIGSKNCIIVKLNRNCNLVKKMTTKQYFWPRGVTVVGDNIMVCDGKRNHVMIFTKELEWVRNIGSHGYGPGQFQDIIDISSDEYGHVYAVDSSRVQIFNNLGSFVRSFGFDKEREGLDALKSPSGICVSGQYVYVTDSTEHNITAYTTDGEYVCSFGGLGGDEGDFKRPLMMCVDKNGYLYVCDYGNKRIQVF